MPSATERVIVMHQSNSSRREQSGAALVIALLLLLVLTLLAVSGMGSAAVEFVMAGNEQYHTRAFQASETGIAQALQVGVFNPDAAVQTIVGAVPTAAPDAYNATLAIQLAGRPQPAYGATAGIRSRPIISRFRVSAVLFAIHWRTTIRVSPSLPPPIPKSPAPAASDRYRRLPMQTFPRMLTFVALLATSVVAQAADRAPS